MSEYIVSARKYRPQTFDTVVGQEHITTTLKNAIRNGHVAHAYLFCGPRGVGKTTCARILARTINCEHPTEQMEACGLCATCTSFKNNTSFNVFELDAASNNSVDDIRTLIEQVRFAPQQGHYKIYIIDEVHMLSAAAFNAFLKTLEEPPPYAIFILATTEKHKILPTILSRCQIFDFRRITTTDITNYLLQIAKMENVVAQESAMHLIAQKSEGCMRDALSMFDRIAGFTDGTITYVNTLEHLNLLDSAFYFEMTDMLLSQDVGGSLLLLSDTLDKGFEGDIIISGLAGHMRNMLLCKDERMARLLDVPADHKALYYEKACQAPPSFILSALNVLNDAELQYKTAFSKRLHVEMCLVRLCYLLQAINADSVHLTDSISTANRSLGDNATNIVPPTGNPSPHKRTDVPGRQDVAETNMVAAPPAHHGQSQQNRDLNDHPEKEKVAADQGSVKTSAQVRRKVSAQIMSQVDDVLNAATTVSSADAILTTEIVLGTFEKYVRKLKEENQTVLYAQFIGMHAELILADEVQIVTEDELAETYARERRNQLIDYFRQQTGVKNLRVTIALRKNEQGQDQKENRVLSRQEVYQVMAQKNPWLGALRDGLNLQVEY